jgi:phosphatidylserine decarboxylase
MKKLLFEILPKNLLSRIVGFLMHIEWPKPLNVFFITAFARAYKINQNEAEAPISAYPSIGAYFTRKLKPGLRPISESPVVHPADSVITQIGRIEKGTAFQAKGLTYSVQQMLGDGLSARDFEGGLFITYYLCPTDYHRVHSPLDAEVPQIIPIHGTLWPVNNWSVSNIQDLFAINERVVFEMKSRLGTAALVMVGATNVGHISTNLAPQIQTNQGLRLSPVKFQRAPQVVRGQELGIFHMGSTVVMIYPKTIADQCSDWPAKWLGKAVKMGESLV